jgi:signal transduction histidine kinase
MFASRLDGKTVELETDVDVLAMTSGRAGDVNHVFMNVIDNALRAIDGTGRIRVRGAVDDGHYVVTIGDSGRGIDDQQLACVFEPFWTTRAAGEGTGLGLAIARQIVEEHGGTIAAGRSSLGGAEFTIRIPLRRAERAA